MHAREMAQGPSINDVTVFPKNFDPSLCRFTTSLDLAAAAATLVRRLVLKPHCLSHRTPNVFKQISMCTLIFSQFLTLNSLKNGNVIYGRPLPAPTHICWVAQQLTNSTIIIREIFHTTSTYYLYLDFINNIALWSCLNTKSGPRFLFPI